MIYSAFRRWKLSSEPEIITPEDRKFAHRFENLKDKIAACYPTEADGRVYKSPTPSSTGGLEQAL